MEQILEEHEIYHPELETEIKELKQFYQNKYWHQLSEAFLKYFEHECFKGELEKFYDPFFKSFEEKIDQIRVMKFIIKMTEEYTDHQKAIEFLDDYKTRILKEKDAIYLYTIQKAYHYLKLNKQEDCFELLNEITKKIKDQCGIDNFVFSQYNKVFALYHSIRKEHAQFYQHSLQYLAYTPETEISTSQKVKISLEMGIAILISKDIYNFSELLEQTVFQSLVNTENHWMYQLLSYFNNGDVLNYQNLIQQQQQALSNNILFASLFDNISILNHKIQLMAFLDLLFNLPKNDRNITFDQIAQRLNIQKSYVELILMKAMSYKLIKGTIDQIDEKIQIDWIMPRILDNQRVQIMHDKIAEWNTNLDEILRSVEAQQSILYTGKEQGAQ